MGFELCWINLQIITESTSTLAGGFGYYFFCINYFSL